MRQNHPSAMANRRRHPDQEIENIGGDGDFDMGKKEVLLEIPGGHRVLGIFFAEKSFTLVKLPLIG